MLNLEKINIKYTTDNSDGNKNICKPPVMIWQFYSFVDFTVPLS